MRKPAAATAGPIRHQVAAVDVTPWSMRTGGASAAPHVSAWNRIPAASTVDSTGDAGAANAPVTAGGSSSFWVTLAGTYHSQPRWPGHSVSAMAVTRNRSPQDRHRDDARSARRRELIQGLLLLAALILLAAVSRLPAG